MSTNEQVPTEQEMRQADVPWPESIEELVAYIRSLTDREHDYGSVCYAMSMAAVAAFQYVAKKEGCTGFQASCADLDIIRRTRLIKGPFMLIKGEDMLYPQYDLHEKLNEAMDNWKEWAAEECAKKLTEVPDAHPDVIAHWEMLAARNGGAA